MQTFGPLFIFYAFLWKRVLFKYYETFDYSKFIYYNIIIFIIFVFYKTYTF